jgi:hypothetical protein
LDPFFIQIVGSSKRELTNSPRGDGEWYPAMSSAHPLFVFPSFDRCLWIWCSTFRGGRDVHNIGVVWSCERTKAKSECSAMLWVYISTGWIVGFVATWLDHSLRGHRKMWKKVAFRTALVVPGTSYACYLLLNFGYSKADSKMAMTGSVLAQLAGYWFGILMPLTFTAGAFVGSHCQGINLPVDKSNPPALIPPQPWYQRLNPLGFVIGGAAVFGATYTHFYFIVSAFLGGQLFDHYGSLLAAYFLASILCGLIASLAFFSQRRRENHRWWWRSSLFPGGGAAIGLKIFAITIPDLGPSIHHAPFVVLAAFYGGILAIACGVLCVYGFVGVMCTLLFNKLLYACVKETGEEELSDSHVSMVEMVSAISYIISRFIL